MLDLTKAYTVEEIEFITEQRSLDVPWSVILVKMVEAGFRDRSLDGIRRALYRRKDGYTERSELHRGADTVDASERRRETTRLMRSDMAFCKALERERPRTGVNTKAGTDRPLPVAPIVTLRSPEGWSW